MNLVIVEGWPIVKYLLFTEQLGKYWMVMIMTQRKKNHERLFCPNIHLGCSCKLAYGENSIVNLLTWNFLDVVRCGTSVDLGDLILWYLKNLILPWPIMTMVILLKEIVRPLTSSPMTRVSLYSHTSTLFSLLSLPSPTNYPFTLDTLIFQPKIKLKTQNFQDMILGVYPLHQECHGWPWVLG